MARSIFKRSNLEEKVTGILDGLGVAYIEQFPSRFGFIIDFAVFTDNKRIALEVDGPYHDTKEQRKKDRLRDYLLKREGWRVFRIHHSEFEDLERVRRRCSEILNF